jgi:hypothetical protein
MAAGTHDGYLLPRRQTFIAIVGVLLGMLLAALNQTIVATALPRIVADSAVSSTTRGCSAPTCSPRR